MTVADDIKVALLKAASNMDKIERSDFIPLAMLFTKQYVVRPRKLPEIYPECELAVAKANAEAISLPVPVRITFDRGPNNVPSQEQFWFHRAEVKND